MSLKFLNPFLYSTPTSTEVTKPLISKFFKSFVVFYTSPLEMGSKVAVDRHSGIIRNMNIWYVELKAKGRRTFIPTSFFYDKVIEIFD